MEIKLRKLDTRGGHRERKPTFSGYELLLDFIWTSFGGAAEVARLLKVHKQQPVNWRLKGAVPLEKVGMISRALKLPPEALNYEGTLTFKGKGLSWEDTVLKTARRLRSRNKALINIIIREGAKTITEILADEKND